MLKAMTVGWTEYLLAQVKNVFESMNRVDGGLSEREQQAKRLATLDISHLDQLQSRISLVGTCIIDEHDLEVLQKAGLMKSEITP